MRKGSKRRDYASPTQAKSTIMGAALLFVGAMEFLECVEKGDHPVKAAKKAVRRVQLRGKAIKKASKEVGPEIRRVEEQERLEESGDDE